MFIEKTDDFITKFRISLKYIYRKKINSRDNTIREIIWSSGKNGNLIVWLKKTASMGLSRPFNLE